MGRLIAIFAFILTASSLLPAQVDIEAHSIMPTGNPIIVVLPGATGSFAANVIDNTGFPFGDIDNYIGNIYLSLDGNLDGGDIFVSSYFASPGFYTGNYTVPGSISSGSYFLILDIPPVPGESGAQQGNNTVAATTPVMIVTEPDMQPASPSIPGGGPVLRDADFDVSWAITNTQTPFAPAFPCEIWLSTDPTIDGSDLLLDTFMATVGSGVESVFMPFSVSPGTYYVGLVIPPVAGETNVNNNTAVSAPVSVQTKAPVLLSVDPGDGGYFGGDPVTLLGENFYEITDIQIGGVSATGILIISDNEVDCVTPPASGGISGTKDVSITTSGGTATLVDGFEYLGAFPGTNEDVRISAELNVFLPSDKCHDIMSGGGGDVLRVIIESPAATLDYHFLYFVGNAFLTGGTPPSPFGFPELYFDPVDPGFFAIIDAGAPNPFFGPPVVLPGGNYLQFALPGNAAGFSATFQAVVLDPNSANMWFSASNAFRIDLM